MSKLTLAFAVPALTALATSIGLGIWGDLSPAGSTLQHVLFTFATTVGLAAVAIGVVGASVVRARIRSRRGG
ncbi:hypothetical protein [Curtobacterium sp. B18]|uniref:hypothetical protein n=1 Tax=Curtobacterium sp. B18 TaxID=95614 RepID=UPI00034C2F64|nr:hypothetical protein [Curtobacterium sp. B18]